MADVSHGAGKIAVDWVNSSTVKTRTNIMYTPVNLLTTGNQTVWDDTLNSDTTVATSDAASDFYDFFSSLCTECLASSTLVEGRVTYVAKLTAGGNASKAYGGDDIEPEEIEEPKSEGETIIDLKGGKQNG